MEDENGWKRLEKYMLACFVRTGLADLYGLGLRDVCECILNGVYRIGLREGLEDQSTGHHTGGRGSKEEKRT
jgi:hypothetical protein